LKKLNTSTIMLSANKFGATSIAGLASLISLPLLAEDSGGRPEKTPNIIIIYLDDMGYGDLEITGAYGYETPNLNKMVSQGMFFSHFYAPQAVCTASRAGLLTGCYPNRIGLTGALGPNSSHGISSDEVTIAGMLKQKGYRTAIYGKWHLGHHEPFLPTRHGFDEFLGIPYSNDMWPFHPQRPEAFPDLPLIRNDQVVNSRITPEDQAQFTTIFTEETVDFIRRNKDHPFFVYLPHPMPHVPLYVSEKFRGKSNQGTYGDVIMEIDWSVGEIMKTLEELDLDDNTLLIFTSDNGPWVNYGNHSGSTGGLREGKGGTFEGGQRVPAIMMWKGVIPEGTVCNNIASAIDILPTLASVTGAPLPKNKIDGVDIFPLMTGDFAANPRKDFFYYYRQNSLQAVRYDNWKLVFAHPGRTYEGFEPGKDGIPGEVNNNFHFPEGLYDLRLDPGERYNLIDYHPGIVSKLEEIALKAREDLGDELHNMPGKNRREPGRLEK
jgi:arylsulfatase A-like enzyme